MAHAFIRLEDPRVHAYAPRYCFLHGPDSALNARLREVVIAAKRELPEEQDAGRIELVNTNEQRAIESVLLETLIVPPSLGVNERTRRGWIRISVARSAFERRAKTSCDSRCQL